VFGYWSLVTGYWLLVIGYQPANKPVTNPSPSESGQAADCRLKTID